MVAWTQEELNQIAATEEVDAAYRAKYRRYAGRILNSCLSPEARSTTIRVIPRA